MFVIIIIMSVKNDRLEAGRIVAKKEEKKQNLQHKISLVELNIAEIRSIMLTPTGSLACCWETF